MWQALGIRHPPPVPRVLSQVQQLTGGEGTPWDGAALQACPDSAEAVFSSLYGFLGAAWAGLPAEARGQLRRCRMVPVGGGVLVKAVEAYAADSLHRVQSLAMHAGKLVTGSRIRQGEMACEVCVRDVTTLLVEHVLGGESFRWRGIPLYTAEVQVLLAERGRVWGGVCQGALMWGYDDIKVKTPSATGPLPRIRAPAAANLERVC